MGQAKKFSLISTNSLLVSIQSTMLQLQGMKTKGLEDFVFWFVRPAERMVQGPYLTEPPSPATRKLLLANSPPPLPKD